MFEVVSSPAFAVVVALAIFVGGAGVALAILLVLKNTRDRLTRPYDDD